jgi:hypothetical protein
VSVVLDTGWGISILTLGVCALVVAAFTLVATAVLTVLVYALELLGVLT